MEKVAITKKKSVKEKSLTNASKERIADKTARNNPNIIEDLHEVNGVWQRIN